MCESNVYLVKGEKEELLMKDVASITLDGNKVYLRSLFGEEKRVSARFKQADLIKHKIIFELSNE